MMKNEGITLIALIITIIILIILTAITLNNVIGTDLIGFATKAAENYIDAGKEEEKTMTKAEAIAAGTAVAEGSEVKAGKIVETTKKDNYMDVTGRTATIPEGFKLSTKVKEQFVEDGLVIQDEEGNEFVWVPCYYGEKPTNAPSDLQEYKSHVYAGTTKGENDTADTTIDSGEGNWKTYFYTKYKNNWKDEATENENSYGNKSVSTYGGFYIARYESGLPEDMQPNLTLLSPKYDSTTKDKNNVENKKPISKKNKFSWNLITQNNAKTVSENMYEDSQSVYSKLVDGAAWDTTTSWVETTGINVSKSSTYGNYRNTNKPYTGWYAEHIWVWKKTEEATFKGWIEAEHFTLGTTNLNYVRLNEDQWISQKANYKNSTGSSNCDTEKNDLDTRIEIPTGSYEDFKLKNIYDLAGNLYEWTTEVGDHNESGGEVTQGLYTVARGGGFGSDGNDVSLEYREAEYKSSDVKGTDITFRVVLYIK